MEPRIQYKGASMAEKQDKSQRKLEYKSPTVECIGTVAELTQSGSVASVEPLFTDGGGSRMCGMGTFRKTCTIP